MANKFQPASRIIRGALAAQICLGTIFILAGLSKLAAHAEFVSEISRYGILTPDLAPVFGSILPWVELAAGCALVLSIFVTPSLIIAGLLALSFLIANSYLLARGLTGSCDCFGQVLPLSYPVSLTLDCLMLVVTGLLLSIRHRRHVPCLTDWLSRLRLRNGKRPTQLIHPTFLSSFLAAVVLAAGLPLYLGHSDSLVKREISASLEQGKPVVLYFYLEGCSECAAQQAVIDVLQATYGRSISFIKADFHKESRLADDFHVFGIPATVLIAAGEGERFQVLEMFHGLAEQNNLRYLLYSQFKDYLWDVFGPLASFSADPVVGEVPVAVQFTDYSLGDITDWAWDFDGDGVADSHERNPTFVYHNTGDYTVSLSVSGPMGSATINKPNLVQTVFTGGEAEFSASPVEFTEPGTRVQFQDESTGTVVMWEWDFDNDGVIDSTERNPTTEYTEPGRYTVSLTVSGPFGYDTVRKQGYIHFVDTGCEANFTASVTEVDGRDIPVTFSDNSSGNVIGWAWDFDGDGTVDSTEQAPVYTYTRNGIYSVTLTVRTATSQNTLTRQDYITVTGCPT